MTSWRRLPVAVAWATVLCLLGVAVSLWTRAHATGTPSGDVLVQQMSQGLQAERGKWVHARTASPVSARIGAAAARGNMDIAARIPAVLSVVGVVLLGLCMAVGLSGWLGGGGALLVLGGFLLSPAVFGLLAHPLPFGLFWLVVWGPPLLLVRGVSCPPGPGRWLWFLLAGSLGGVAVFTHHLGLWTSLATFCLVYLAVDRKPSPTGQIALPPLALETLALGLGFVLAAATLWPWLRTNGEGWVAFQFHHFSDPVEPFAFWGTVYRSGGNGSAPFYAVWVLWMVRTLPAVLISAIAALALSVRWRAGTRPAIPLPGSSVLLLGPVLPVLVIGSSTGNPLYAPESELLSFLAFPAVVLCVHLLTSLWRVRGDMPGVSSTWARGTAAGLLVLLLGHGFLVQCQLHPFPGTYANGLGRGTRFALLQGNDVFSEPMVTPGLAHELKGESRIVSVPLRGRWSKLPAKHPEDASTLRDGGAFPLLVWYRPGSLAWRIFRQAVQDLEPDAVETGAGVPLWSLYTAGRRGP